MSLYPKEAYGLYRKYSTKVAHTIKTYSDFTIPYPYPVAQSIEASSYFVKIIKIQYNDNKKEFR